MQHDDVVGRRRRVARGTVASLGVRQPVRDARLAEHVAARNAAESMRRRVDLEADHAPTVCTNGTVPKQ